MIRIIIVLGILLSGCNKKQETETTTKVQPVQSSLNLHQTNKKDDFSDLAKKEDEGCELSEDKLKEIEEPKVNPEEIQLQGGDTGCDGATEDKK